MDMRHSLPPLPAAINRQAVSPLVDAFLLGNLIGYIYEMSNELSVLRAQLTQGWYVLSGHHQYVRRSFGFPIPKSDDLVVLIDYVTWYLASDDSTENAVLVHFAPLD